MKTLPIITLTLFAAICQAQTTQFEKPRYLKYATLLCPIDITKSYSKKGLLGENNYTVTITEIKSLEETKDTGGNKVYIPKTLKDTILVKTILIDNGSAFNVVQQIGSYSIIKFWNLSESSAKGLITGIKIKFKKDNIVYKEIPLNKTFETMKINGLKAVIDSVGYDLSESYYIVPTKTILNNSIEFENKNGLWNIGLLALPVKIRPFATESGHFDFSNGFSVGTTFAWTAHHNWKTNFTHSFLLYAGLSSYKADSIKIKEKREDYTIAAFSPAVGWMWQKNNVQLGFLVGIDFPTGNIQQKWVYRNQPWFGIGVGIALFNINSDTQTKSGKN